MHCSIIPPYLLRRLARQDAPQFSAAARAAKEALIHVRSVQAARAQPAPAAPSVLRQVQPGPPNRTIYDAGGSETLPGKLVRKEGERPRAIPPRMKPTTAWAIPTACMRTSSAGTPSMAKVSRSMPPSISASCMTTLFGTDARWFSATVTVRFSSASHVR